VFIVEHNGGHGETNGLYCDGVRRSVLCFGCYCRK